jgi:ElaB/YqjD/DUF883 family membrane-anchored ribosome-binding protein
MRAVEPANGRRALLLQRAPPRPQSTARGADMNRTDFGSEGQRTQQETERGRVRANEPGAGVLDVDRLREVGQNLSAQLEEQVHKRPYVVVGAAAGVGFVLGSLLGSRLGQVLLAAGVGYVLKNVVGGDLGVESIEQNLEKLTGERQQA